MTLEIVGAGWGRTATNSLKVALEQLGYGTVHHMYEVGRDPDRLVPLWTAALDGKPDWEAIFAGNRAACDWPVAAFWSEVLKANPAAKVILTTRSAESWYDSVSETILKVDYDPEQAPPPLVGLVRMARRAAVRSIGEDWSRAALIDRFNAHEAAVKSAVPADRLLVFSPKEGWDPLCAFLDKPVPDTPFPRTNDRDEFFAMLARMAS